MEQEKILHRYKILGNRLYRHGNRGLQLKILKECMIIIEESFVPEFDGREKLMEKLNHLHKIYMDAVGDTEKQTKANDAICVVAACIAFFQEVK